MPLVKDYVSNLFRSMPEASGHLAIHITENKCTIAICSSSGVLTFLRSLSKPNDTYIHNFVKDIFAEHQILFSKEFESITIGISTTNFTLLPNSFTVEHKAMMDFVSGSPTRKAFANDIEALNAKFIYSIPEPLLQVIEQNFQHYNLVPATKYGIEQTSNLQVDCILIFEDNYFDCFTYSNNQLQSVNRHQFETPEDVVYFVGLSLKDAAVTPEQAKVIASGSIKTHSPVFNLLYRYFQTVEVRAIETSISVRPDFESPQQEYQYVLNLLHANY